MYGYTGCNEVGATSRTKIHTQREIGTFEKKIIAEVSMH